MLKTMRAIEALDEQDVAAHRLSQLDARGFQAGAIRELHCRELALDHRICVGARRELCDQIAAFVPQNRLRTCAANRAAVEERQVEGARERPAFVDGVGRSHQLRKRRGRLVATDVDVGAVLEVEGANPVGARSQEVCQRPESRRVLARGAGAEQVLLDDPLTPGVWTCILDAAGDRQPAKRRDCPRA
jgi:hypothetical protein